MVSRVTDVARSTSKQCARNWDLLAIPSAQPGQTDTIDFTMHSRHASQAHTMHCLMTDGKTRLRWYGIEADVLCLC
jgi:hypothetical protein